MLRSLKGPEVNVPDNDIHYSSLTREQIKDRFYAVGQLGSYYKAEGRKHADWNELIKLSETSDLQQVSNIKDVLATICRQAYNTNKENDTKELSAKLYQSLSNIIENTVPPYPPEQLNEFLRNLAYDNKACNIIYNYMINNNITICKRSISTAMRPANIARDTAQKIVINADRGDLLEGINLLKKRTDSLSDDRYLLTLDGVLKKRDKPPYSVYNIYIAKGKTIGNIIQKNIPYYIELKGILIKLKELAKGDPGPNEERAERIIPKMTHQGMLQPKNKD